MNITATGKLDQLLGAQSTALALREQRQQVLASNIANADTPGYKAVDFNFANALRAATGAMGGAAPLQGGNTSAASATPAASEVLAQTARGHMSGSQSAYAGLSTAIRTQYRMPAQPSADGNSVDMNLEGARFAENSVKYEAALKFLNGQIKTLLSAIQG